ncbi:helix-turn-helix domain-containing protein [bacterium]|jgi:transcriptional regulator with XRE-family HTH domain|nr:helix-turn-helix domain-containing protein [bacterium]
MNEGKSPRIVGNYIRERRESAGLSQKALGQLFSPPVTTQFISNIERGVTPLPPVHISTLTKALNIPENELLTLMEKEYLAKLSGRLDPHSNGVAHGAHDPSATWPDVKVAPEDFLLIHKLYDAYKNAGPEKRQEFLALCESVLNFSASRLNKG